jgi:response regulator RpfG family c-di-GMP phosphodiesterase
MLTGHNTDSDTILGLESGANDYVAKPFRFAVLLARIRAQLRQHEASEDAVFTIGPYTFQPRSKILLNQKGNKVRLTEKETVILRYLYRAVSALMSAIVKRSPATNWYPWKNGSARPGVRVIAKQFGVDPGTVQRISRPSPPQVWPPDDHWGREMRGAEAHLSPAGTARAEAGGMARG